MHDALIPQRFSKSLTVIPVLPPQASPVAMRIVAVIAAFAAAQASFLESTGPGALGHWTWPSLICSNWSGPTEKELRYWFVLLKMVLSCLRLYDTGMRSVDICGDVRGHTCCHFGRHCQASNRSCRARFAHHACSLLADLLVECLAMFDGSFAAFVDTCLFSLFI